MKFTDKANILGDVKLTKRFIKNHPEIVIGRSDKGNSEEN